MTSQSQPRLSVFDTFKTKTQELTGEALRQRSIIICLATQTSAADRTRTSISQQIAEENGIVWKNIYSGIFRDLDTILVPMGFVVEEGRLPMKRGPKALQEKGIPFYGLTHKGLIVSLSLEEIIGREKILEKCLSTCSTEEKPFFEKLLKLSRIAPRFTFSIFEKYVKAYCQGRVRNLGPFSFSEIRDISDESIKINRELLEGFSNLSKPEKQETLNLLNQIS